GGGRGASCAGVVHVRSFRRRTLKETSEELPISGKFLPVKGMHSNRRGVSCGPGRRKERRLVRAIARRRSGPWAGHWGAPATRRACVPGVATPRWSARHRLRAAIGAVGGGRADGGVLPAACGGEGGQRSQPAARPTPQRGDSSGSLGVGRRGIRAGS